MPEESVACRLQRELCKNRNYMHKRILCAVSGGEDSMTMLHLLCAVQEELDLKLAVATLHHGIRSEAEKERQLVKSFCEAHNIPFFTARAVLAKGGDGRTSEQTARRCRYAFLDHTAKKWKADAIALAHHREDQAETVLLRILRGTGMRGIAGMAVEHGRYWRPLLHVPKDWIHEYAQEQKIPFLQDASNLDTAYLRNRIRHELLPLLRDYQPQIVAHLASLAEVARQDEQALSTFAGQRWEALARYRLAKRGISLQRKGFCTELPAIQYRLVCMCLAFLGQRDYTRSAVERTIEAIKLGKKTDLGHGIVAEGKGAYASFYFPIATQQIVPAGPHAILSALNAGLSCESAPGLVVRTRRDGDVCANGKPLSECYKKKGIPYWVREVVPVLAEKNKVLWAPFGIASERAVAYIGDTVVFSNGETSAGKGHDLR